MILNITENSIIALYKIIQIIIIILHNLVLLTDRKLFLITDSKIFLGTDIVLFLFTNTKIYLVTDTELLLYKNIELFIITITVSFPCHIYIIISSYFSNYRIQNTELITNMSYTSYMFI